MKKTLELSKKDSDYLAGLPEQGMGYQIVNITLKNGQVLRQRIVINSTYLILNEDEQLNVKEIEYINTEDQTKTH